jgi:hypothetical protein
VSPGPTCFSLEADAWSIELTQAYGTAPGPPPTLLVLSDSLFLARPGRPPVAPPIAADARRATVLAGTAADSGYYYWVRGDSLFVFADGPFGAGRTLVFGTLGNELDGVLSWGTDAPLAEGAPPVDAHRARIRGAMVQCPVR